MAHLLVCHACHCQCSAHRGDHYEELEARQRCETQTLEEYEKFCLGASLTLGEKATTDIS